MLSAIIAFVPSGLTLPSLKLTRHLECSHQSYDYVHKMAVQDSVIYLEPHRFTRG